MTRRLCQRAGRAWPGLTLDELAKLPRDLRNQLPLMNARNELDRGPDRLNTLIGSGQHKAYRD